MHAECAVAPSVRPTSEVCIKSGKGKERTCTADHGVNRAMEPGDCAPLYVVFSCDALLTSVKEIN